MPLGDGGELERHKGIQPLTATWKDAVLALH